MAKTDTTTTTQKNEPWSVAQPYYSDLYKKAQEAFDATNGTNTYAGPTNTQLQANQQLKDTAAGLGTGVDPIRQLALSQLNGDWLSPDTNPYIKQVATAALKPLEDSFYANVGSIKDKAIAQGAYGGARQDLQENKALSDLMANEGNITSSIYGQNYANERQIQQSSPSLLNSANLLALAGPTALAGAGATEQGWNQGALSGDLQGKWQGLSELANILGSGGFGTSTGTQTTPTNTFASILQGALGGASTGASLATGIGGVAAGAGLGAFAPWMLPLAALGGLAGGLG